MSALVKCYREAYILHPEFFNDALFQATIMPKHRLPDNWSTIVEKLKENAPHNCCEKPTSVTIGIDWNFDGTPVKSDSAEFKDLWPFLVKLSSLEIPSGERFLFHHDRSPVIPVGFLHCKGKISAQDVLPILVEDARKHNIALNGTAPISIKLERGMLDSPALADVRATKYPTGYDSLAKCTYYGETVVVGEKTPVPGKIVQVKQCRFPSTMFCKPRSDADWDSYKGEKKVRENTLRVFIDYSCMPII